MSTHGETNKFVYWTKFKNPIFSLLCSKNLTTHISIYFSNFYVCDLSRPIISRVDTLFNIWAGPNLLLDL